MGFALFLGRRGGPESAGVEWHQPFGARGSVAVIDGFSGNDSILMGAVAMGQ